MFYFWCSQLMCRRCQANISGIRKPEHTGEEASSWANTSCEMKCLIKMFICDGGALLDWGKAFIPNICSSSLWKRVQWIQLTEQKRLPKVRCTPSCLPRGLLCCLAPWALQRVDGFLRCQVLSWEKNEMCKEPLWPAAVCVNCIEA